MKQRILAILGSAVIALALVGCGAAAPAPAVPHPNAVSALDGQAYDALLAANAAISRAELDVRAGTLASATWTPIINDAIKAYNVAEGAWLTYRQAVQATPADATSGAQYQALLTDVQTLNTAVQALTKGN